MSERTPETISAKNLKLAWDSISQFEDEFYASNPGKKLALTTPVFMSLLLYLETHSKYGRELDERAIDYINRGLRDCIRNDSGDWVIFQERVFTVDPK